MGCKHYCCESGDRDGIPVEQPNISPNIEVGEERHREIALGVERNTARDVAGGGPEKNREEKIGQNKIKVPITLPKAIIDVSADFDRNSAQNQAPQNQKQRKVVACKGRRHQAREDRDQCSAETEEPYLMPCP